MTALINIYDVQNDLIEQTKSAAFQLDVFDKITEGYFYAYDNIDFVKQCKVNAFHPDYAIETLGIPELIPDMDQLRVVTNIFWDVYVPLSITAKQVFSIFTSVISQTSVRFRDSPDVQALTYENCKFHRLEEKTLLILFPESFYNIRKFTYFTVLQFQKEICPQFNISFDFNQFSSYPYQIPFFYKEEAKHSFLYLIKNTSPPFSKTDIIQHLYMSDGNLFTMAHLLLENARAFPTYQLRLPKKFRSPQQQQIFSTKTYQKFVAEFMLHNAGLLCWHDAGTGKTLTSIMTIIALLRTYTDASVIIICPASLKQQWEQVIRDHVVPPPTSSFLPRFRECLQLQQKIRVISYQFLTDRLIKWILVNKGDLNKEGFAFIKSIFEDIQPKRLFAVFDEIHEVSNDYVQTRKSPDYIRSMFPQTSKLVKIEQPTGNYWIRLFLTCFVEKVVFLTATPIQNTVKDLLPILQNIMIVYLKQEGSLKDMDTVLFWKNGFMKRWKDLTPIQLDNQFFEKVPLLPDYYNENLFVKTSMYTSELIDLQSTLRACANFRGMIHRIRASVPGRNFQKQRKVQQKDAFPQEITEVHHIPVATDSLYFHEYKKLISEKVVSKDLRDVRFALNNDLVYHQSTSLYTNQRESATCIYQLRYPETLFDRKHAGVQISNSFTNPVLLNNDQVRIAVKNTLPLRSLQKIMIGNEQFPIAGLSQEQIRIHNPKHLPISFFQKQSTFHAERPSFRTRASVSSRFMFPFPVQTNGNQLIVKENIHQTKIFDPKKKQYFTIEPFDLLLIRKEYYTIQSVSPHAIIIDRALPSSKPITMMEVLKPSALTIDNIMKRSPTMIEVEKTDRISNFLSQTNDDFVIRLDGNYYPIKSIFDHSKTYTIETVKDLPANVPKTMKVLSFRYSENTTLSNIRPNLDLNRPKKPRFRVNTPYEKLSEHSIRILKQDVPFLSFRVNDDLSLQMDGRIYPIHAVREDGLSFILETQSSFPEMAPEKWYIVLNSSYLCSPKIDFMRGLIPDSDGNYLRLTGKNQKVIIFMAFLKNMEILQSMMNQPLFFTKTGKTTILSMDTDDPIKRNQIVQRFHSEKNNVILLISKKSATGLDLRGVTDIVFLDLVWTASLYTQIVGRGVRFYSHAFLDLSERKVRVHVLLLQSLETDIKFVDEIMWTKIQNKEWIQKNIDNVLLYNPHPLISEIPPFGEKMLGGLLVNPPLLLPKRGRQQQGQQLERMKKTKK